MGSAYAIRKDNIVFSFVIATALIASVLPVFNYHVPAVVMAAAGVVGLTSYVLLFRRLTGDMPETLCDSLFVYYLAAGCMALFLAVVSEMGFLVSLVIAMSYFVVADWMVGLYNVAAGRLVNRAEEKEAQQA